MTMTATAPTIKRCGKCGKDVTGAKRLKDAKGHYWCVDCGAPEAASSPTSLSSPCPRCDTPTHPTQFVRKDGHYICEKCAEGGPRGRTAAAAANQKRLVLAGTLLGLAGIAYGVLNYVVFV